MNSRFLLTLACAAGLVAAVPTALHARGNDAARNAVIGGIAGAIIGEHNDHRAAEGALIGVAAGLLLTALTDDSGYDSRGTYYETSAPCPPPYRGPVLVSRPYCPPTRVVIVPPSHHYGHRTVVVHPPARAHHRVVVVAPRHDGRRDRHEARYDRRDNRYDRRDNRHDRRNDRRDDRRDRR